MKSAFGVLDPVGGIRCDSVYGVNDGDTCFGVSKTFNLRDSINPNLLNCTNLFIGQWLCIFGKTT